MLTLSTDDYLWFVDQALDAMTAIVRDLGDVDANRAIDTAGSNSPYVILAHCLGVLEFWGGAMVAGRAIERDRDAEFVAEGPVAELIERTVEARRRFAADLAALDSPAPPPGAVKPEDAGLPFATTQGGVLVHVYEELVQHLGQMEITRDVLRGH